MAKFYNNRVKTGKLAGSVFAIRNGETIERAYQPIVTNPSTPAQVATRAKLKLMSQLSAVLAPYIAMRRNGAVSPRNLFVKKNYRLADYQGNAASIELNLVQLTNSVVGLPNLYASRGETAITAYLSIPQGTTPDFDRVVYVLVDKRSDNTLSVVATRVVTAAGADGRWAVEDFPMMSDSAVVYAYAIRDNTEAARVVFGDMQALTAETMAKILTSSVLLQSDVTLTETRAVTIPAGV